MADILAILWLVILIPVWIFAALFASDDPNGSPLLTASSIVFVLALPSIIYFAMQLYKNPGSQFRIRKPYLIVFGLFILWIIYLALTQP